MTLNKAADAAADRDSAVEAAKHQSTYMWWRDLYVRAFRAGYQQAQKDALRSPQPAPKFHLNDDDGSAPAPH